MLKENLPRTTRTNTNQENEDIYYKYAFSRELNGSEVVIRYLGLGVYDKITYKNNLNPSFSSCSFISGKLKSHLVRAGSCGSWLKNSSWMRRERVVGGGRR